MDENNEWKIVEIFQISMAITPIFNRLKIWNKWNILYLNNCLIWYVFLILSII